VKKVGKVGFKSANPHKYWILYAQTGVFEFVQKWAFGRKINDF
jgi:hypothetical protein